MSIYFTDVVNNDILVLI